MIKLANKMLHSGPMNRLTATMSSTVPTLSTCLLLLLQFQTFHALPTSSSSTFGNNAALLNAPSAPQDGSSASLPASTYAQAFSYSSYRPGASGARLDSYRPYRTYYPKEDAAPAGLYLGENLHPNSVYSSQSPSLTSSNQNLDKVLQYIEKEFLEEETNRDGDERGRYASKVTIPQEKVAEEKYIISLPRRRDNNKPKLAPLPSVALPQVNVRKEHVQKGEDQPKYEPLPSNPIPPPFAPELDPQYERRQYGLGALSLLDQAGPFW